MTYTAVCLSNADLTIPGFLTRAGAASYADRTGGEWMVVTDEEYRTKSLGELFWEHGHEE